MNPLQNLITTKKIMEYSLILFFIFTTLLTYSSIGRPIWIDEFLHFVFGSATSFEEAWKLFLLSRPINHGQTGTYILLDYLLLHVFGANAFALRIPSLISGCWLLIAAIQFIRGQGLSYLWQLMVVFILFSQTTLMYFTGEARPYMPLAAAVAGTLAYYAYPYSMRQSFLIMIMGIISVLWGVTMHPYFILYWVVIYFFTSLVLVNRHQLQWSFSELLKQANPFLFIVGMAIYFLIAIFTWGPNVTKYNFNPFEFIYLANLPYEFFDQHFKFLYGQFYLFGLLLIPLTFSLIPNKKRGLIISLIPPLTLIFVALFLSAFISYISYKQNYWILLRQWIASIGLVSIGIVWLLGETFRIFQFRSIRFNNALYASLILIMSGIIVFHFLNHYRNLNSIFNYSIADNCSVSTSKHEPPPLDITTRLPQAGDADIWVKAANDNIACGGPVWSWFKTYYLRSAGIL